MAIIIKTVILAAGIDKEIDRIEKTRNDWCLKKVQKPTGGGRKLFSRNGPGLIGHP